MTFAWKKDNELLQDAEMENYAHLRAQGGEVMEYTTILRLRNVEFSNEGKYQCVISNHFGSSYSVKAKLTVNSKYVMFCLKIHNMRLFLIIIILNFLFSFLLFLKNLSIAKFTIQFYLWSQCAEA